LMILQTMIFQQLIVRHHFALQFDHPWFLLEGFVTKNKPSVQIYDGRDGKATMCRFVQSSCRLDHLQQSEYLTVCVDIQHLTMSVS
jgi:hypothetical protein